MTTPAKHDALQTKPSDGAPATPTRSPVARLTAKSSEPAWAMIDSNIDPQHVVLRISDLMLRYDCSKTTACALVNEPDFPGQVAPRCWRLDHVMESEDARAWAGRVRPTPRRRTTSPASNVPARASSAAHPRLVPGRRQCDGRSHNFQRHAEEGLEEAAVSDRKGSRGHYRTGLAGQAVRTYGQFLGLPGGVQETQRRRNGCIARWLSLHR